MPGLITWLLGLLLIVFAACPVRAQGPSEAAELKRLSTEIMSAVQRKDRARLDAMLAPDFRLTAPGAGPQEGVPRATWIDNAVGRDWSDFRYENVAVRLFGDGAIVTSRLHFRVSPMPFDLDSDIVDVWHRTGRGWQLHRRYLGQSNRQRQMSFAAGLVVGLLLIGLVLGVRRLLRRRMRVRPAI